ncbi:TraR/DksA family transcriptional regulator [Streptomyces sp. NPDC002187]|uniref:TraR/DksA family transcriptional regulator n=1 Tax=Streptomyces sp. NPDC002187 TaxID=3364637 RepID=UPI003673B2D3
MATKKTTAKKTTPKKTAEKAGRTDGKKSVDKKAGKKSVDKKSVDRNSVDTSTVDKEPAAKKTAEKKATTRKAAARSTGKSPAKDTAAGRTASAPRKAQTTKATAKKATATKAAAAMAARKAAPAAEGAAAQAAKQTGARTVGAKKTKSAVAVPTARAVGAVSPGELAVRPGEDPWTDDEVSAARAGLESEVTRLNAELTASEVALTGLMRDSGNGAGDDEADTGTKNITREHEMALAANARESLEQSERALQRLDSGTYGLCENCGNPIGKARMQAFPRATLCVECKQKQERRG